MPIMKEDAVKVPEMQKIAPTKPEPFKLQIKERVEARLTQWQENVEKELEEQKRAAEFKATEPKVLEKAAVHKAQPIRNYKPVEVKPSEKPLTLPSSPKFLSGTSKAMNTTYSNN